MARICSRSSFHRFIPLLKCSGRFDFPLLSPGKGEWMGLRAVRLALRERQRTYHEAGLSRICQQTRYQYAAALVRSRRLRNRVAQAGHAAGECVHQVRRNRTTETATYPSDTGCFAKVGEFGSLIFDAGRTAESIGGLTAAVNCADSRADNRLQHRVRWARRHQSISSKKKKKSSSSRPRRGISELRTQRQAPRNRFHGQRSVVEGFASEAIRRDQPEQ